MNVSFVVKLPTCKKSFRTLAKRSVGEPPRHRSRFVPPHRLGVAKSTGAVFVVVLMSSRETGVILQSRALKSRALLSLAANLRIHLVSPLVLLGRASIMSLLLVRLLVVRPLFPLLELVMHRHRLAMPLLAAPQIAHLVDLILVLSEVVLESVVLEEVVVEEVMEEVAAEEVELL